MTLRLMGRDVRWMWFLSLLLLGVGFCGGILAERVVLAPVDAASDAGSDHTGRRRHTTVSSISELADELGLTVGQRTEVAERAKEATLRIGELEKQLREVESDAREKVLGLLTAEQHQKLEAHQDGDRERWAQRSVEEEVRKWSIILDLTAEQRAKYESVAQDFQKRRMESFRQQHDKGGRPDWDKGRQLMKELQEKKTEALREFLTEAQMTKYVAIDRDPFDR